MSGDSTRKTPELKDFTALRGDKQIAALAQLSFSELDEIAREAGFDSRKGFRDTGGYISDGEAMGILSHRNAIYQSYGGLLQNIHIAEKLIKNDAVDIAVKYGHLRYKDPPNLLKEIIDLPDSELEDIQKLTKAAKEYAYLGGAAKEIKEHQANGTIERLKVETHYDAQIADKQKAIKKNTKELKEAQFTLYADNYNREQEKKFQSPFEKVTGNKEIKKLDKQIKAQKARVEYLQDTIKQDKQAIADLRKERNDKLQDLPPPTPQLKPATQSKQAAAEPTQPKPQSQSYTANQPARKSTKADKTIPNPDILQHPYKQARAGSSTNKKAKEFHQGLMNSTLEDQQKILENQTLENLASLKGDLEKNYPNDPEYQNLINDVKAEIDAKRNIERQEKEAYIAGGLKAKPDDSTPALKEQYGKARGNDPDCSEASVFRNQLKSIPNYKRDDILEGQSIDSLKKLSKDLTNYKKNTGDNKYDRVLNSVNRVREQKQKAEIKTSPNVQPKAEPTAAQPTTTATAETKSEKEAEIQNSSSSKITDADRNYFNDQIEQFQTDLESYREKTQQQGLDLEEQINQCQQQIEELQQIVENTEATNQQVLEAGEALLQQHGNLTEAYNQALSDAVLANAPAAEMQQVDDPSNVKQDDISNAALPPSIAKSEKKDELEVTVPTSGHKPSLTSGKDEGKMPSLTSGSSEAKSPSLTSGSSEAKTPSLTSGNSDKISTEMAAGPRASPKLESGADKNKPSLESDKADEDLGSKISDKKTPKVGKPIPTGKNWYDLIRMILKLLMEDGLLKGLTDGLVKGIPEAAVNLIGAGMIKGMERASQEMATENPSMAKAAQQFVAGFAEGTAKSPGIALQALIHRAAHEVIKRSEYGPLMQEAAKATKQNKQDPAAILEDKAAQYTHDVTKEIGAGASMIANPGKALKSAEELVDGLVKNGFKDRLGQKDKQTASLRNSGTKPEAKSGASKTIMPQFNRLTNSATPLKEIAGSTLVQPENGTLVQPDKAKRAKV